MAKPIGTGATPPEPPSSSPTLPFQATAAKSQSRGLGRPAEMSPFFVKLWQALVSGVSIGSIYALIAEGYYITFVTTGALNFGQGEFLMIGALFGLTCYVTFGLPYAVALI